MIQKKHVIGACCWNFRIDQTSYTSFFYLKVDNKRTGFSVGEQHSCRRKARFSFLHDLLQSFLSHSFSHVSINAAVIQGIRCGIAFFKERGFVDFPMTSNSSYLDQAMLAPISTVTRSLLFFPAVHYTPFNAGVLLRSSCQNKAVSATLKTSSERTG